MPIAMAAFSQSAMVDNKSPRAQVQSPIPEFFFIQLVDRGCSQEIQKKLHDRQARAASRGFTHEYQNAWELLLPF